jgi:hypothetical protein
MYIKPTLGRTQDGLVQTRVYDPDRRDIIPPEGREVPESGYWLRRIMEGGVVRAHPPQEEPGPSEEGPTPDK